MSWLGVSAFDWLRFGIAGVAILIGLGNLLVLRRVQLRQKQLGLSLSILIMLHGRRG